MYAYDSPFYPNGHSNEDMNDWGIKGGNLQLNILEKVSQDASNFKGNLNNSYLECSEHLSPIKTDKVQPQTANFE